MKEQTDLIFPLYKYVTKSGQYLQKHYNSDLMLFITLLKTL